MATSAADESGGQVPSQPSRRADQSILVIDDSAVVRRLVTEVVNAEPGFAVVGQAAGGAQGVQLARQLRPDCVILDLHMPGMDGFEALRAMRADAPELRVVVFANVEPENLNSVSDAVRAAPAELVVKPTGVTDLESALHQIRQRLVHRLRRPDPVVPRPTPPRGNHVAHAIVMAASTGGPNALERVLGGIGHLTVPIFIVQHISAGFSTRLASRLDQVASFPVSEAADGIHPEPGHAYLSPGGIHLTLERDGARPIIRLKNLPPVNSCRPSADVLFHSAASVYGRHQLGVVLTGIGEDGLAGCRSLADLGAPILVQDEASSVVWGMPGAVATAGVADEILPLERMGSRIERLIAAPRPTARSNGGVIA